MRSHRATQTLLAFVLILSGCDLPLRRLDDLSGVSPLPVDYKQKISAWAKGFFVEYRSLRAVLISEPIPIDTPSGAAWLVCVEADAQARQGGYLGPKRFAFGFKTATSKDPKGKDIATIQGFSAPLDRSAVQLSGTECDRLPLQWTPWPALERLS